MRIETCSDATLEAWLALRQALWPAADHRAEARARLARGDDAVTFLAMDDRGAAVGFAEATLRRDYVEGCTTSPVAFLEGIYVRPEARRRGIARQLCAAVEAWGRGLGCTEMASDADLSNTASHDMHRAVGFEETGRVVFFRKPLA